MAEDHLEASLTLLSDRCRREVIHQLRDEVGGESTLDDLVDRLEGSETVYAPDGGTSRDRLAIELAHKHLPKLDDHGIVEYDPEDERVRYRRDEQVEELLDTLSGAVVSG